MPDILKPPNGWRCTSAPVILRLMYRLPTRNSRLTRLMFSGLREYSPPVRAYGVPLALASASSRSAARRTARTGPKISSWAMVQVGVVVHDDGVLAAQLGDDALDVVLPRRLRGGLAVDEQADVARPRKGDHRHVGMADEGRPDFLADAGQIVEHAAGDARLLED